MTAATRIIGVGNPLMGDDGIGIAAAERLAALALPQEVEAIDGGTGGLTLLDLMAGADKVILIDAVEMGKPAGSIVRFAPGEVAMEGGRPGLSLHETDLSAVFALGREMDLLPPQIVIYGVEPCSVERRLGLSPAVADALDPLVEAILSELTLSVYSWKVRQVPGR